MCGLAGMVDWPRAPLREWTGELFASRRLEEAGLPRPDAVPLLWCQHLSGSWHHANALRAVAMFEREQPFDVGDVARVADQLATHPARQVQTEVSEGMIRTGIQHDRLLGQRSREALRR